MSTIVFFATILGTKKSGIPVWKSSSLVYLQCMVSDNGLGSSREVEKQAKTFPVQLRENGIGWQLVDTRVMVDEA
jgi:hypothetical protein